MPTPVSYLSGASLSNTVGMFKRGTMAQNLKSSLESGYRWWNGIEVTSSQYLIYSDTYTMGTSTLANSIPVAWSTPDLTDQNLLNLINTLPPRVGQTAFTSLPIALQWLQSSNKFFLIRGGTENIVKSGLQLYADAGRFDSYIGNGTTWSDLSSNGNNGTLVNGTGYNSSGVGSMVFDGTNDYVSFGNAASLQITNALTVDVWLKANTSGDFITAVAKSNGATGGWTVQLRNLVNEWRFWVNFGVNTLGNGSNNGWYYANFPKTWNDNKWHHFVGIWDGSSKTVKLYIDGIQGTFNAGGNPSGESSSIGNYNGNLVAGSETGGNNPLNGNISSLKVYNIAFSPEQVLQNYNTQKLRFGYYDSVQDGLVLNLDASNYLSYPRSGTTWTDLTGKGNNGTLTNGPTFSGGTTPSIVFDGANDYVRAPFETILNDCTIEVWFNSNSIKTYQYLLSIGKTNTNEYSFYLDMNDTDYGSLAQTMWVYWNSGGVPNSMVSKTGSNVVNGTSYGDWNDSTWRCYTFTRSVTDSPYTKHYMNGLEVTNVTRQSEQTTKFGNGSGYEVTLAAYRSNNLNFSGNQSIVKIYNKVLSPQEIIQNFESQRVNYGITGITTNGLVLNLDAANTASYGGSGTVWGDISGGEFDGTLINGSIYSSSGASSSISFDGVDDYVNTIFTTQLDNFTICAWFKCSGITSSYPRIADKNYQNGFWFGKEASLANKWGGGVKQVSGYNMITLDDSSWHYLVMVRNGTSLTVYGDGITNNNTTTCGSGSLDSTPMSLGGTINDGGSLRDWFKGNIASIHLYNRAITTSEILQNYNATKGRFGL
jgi:hypothetical protein